jgi:hypothetical protein
MEDMASHLAWVPHGCPVARTSMVSHLASVPHGCPVARTSMASHLASVPHGCPVARTSMASHLAGTPHGDARCIAVLASCSDCACDVAFCGCMLGDPGESAGALRSRTPRGRAAQAHTGSPRPHLHRDWARPACICTGTARGGRTADAPTARSTVT